MSSLELLCSGCIAWSLFSLLFLLRALKTAPLVDERGRIVKE